jgi:hypothetical protein
MKHVEVNEKEIGMANTIGKYYNSKRIPKPYIQFIH